jgi:catechol 2,3-dioxygenase-like lactoylglutathione lyase family enzyme
MEPQLGWPAWIGVVAEDLDAQTAFYRDVLGMREVDRSEEWVQLDLDGRKFEILAKTQDPQYDERRVQIGFEVADIRDAADRLVARGVERISEIERDPESGSSWCYFRDPEGNVFEITQTGDQG